MNEHDRSRIADGVAFVVYGSINVLAAVGGLRLESEALKAREAAAVVVVVAVAAWMAHSMWRVVSARARRETEPERSHELHELLRSWPILASGFPGTAALLLAGAGAWSVATGLLIAQALGVAVLLAAGLLTARLAGGTRSRQVVYAIALPSVGLAIVLLEVTAHHV